MRRIVTLLTDFGQEDAYVGIMKGVILSHAPEVQLVDLTHAIPPQDLVQGAFHLWAAVEVFPEGTIHLAVVDPGVGGERRAIAAEAGGQWFVGPDNGLLWSAIQRFPQIRVVELTQTAFFRTTISDTFHGRDIFAPVVGHLASGRILRELGTAISDPIALDIFDVEGDGERIWGRVLSVDRFGNLCTNLSKGVLRMFPDLEDLQITVGPHEITTPLSKTFSDVMPGALVVYFNSYGLLEIALRGGSAAKMLDIQAGTPLWLERA